MTFESRFRHCERFHCPYLKHASYIMYEVSYNGRTSYVSNYFYCRIRPERLLCDAERDLLEIAKFFWYYFVCSFPRGEFQPPPPSNNRSPISGCICNPLYFFVFFPALNANHVDSDGQCCELQHSDPK